MSVNLDKTSPATPIVVTPMPVAASQSQTCKLPGHREGLRMNDLASLQSAIKSLAQRGHLPLALRAFPGEVAPVDHGACILCR